MTALAPARAAGHRGRRGSNLSGTLGMLRLGLRRDRIAGPLWVLLLALPPAWVYLASITSVYPTAADRAGLAAGIMASPAQRAMYGQIYNDSLGAVGIWKAGILHLLIAVATILTVIRHTRADEETGRTELLDSTAVGRYAGLTSALLLAAGASVATGLITTIGLLTTDVPAAGSWAFGAALAASGLVFAAVAAVAAQLSPSARFARGAAFGVLAVAFTLRAVGDAGSGGLSWLSPLGWSLQVRPYAGERWWVLLLHLAATVALTWLAYRIAARRDVGAGLLADRPGPRRAAPTLAGAFGLAWRLDRAALALWTVGLVLYGLLVGSVVHGIGDEVGSDSARDIVARLGGTAELEQAFIAVAFAMLGMIASAFAVSLMLRVHTEEQAARAETLLSAALSRPRWLTGHLVLALAGPAVAMLAAGAVAGLVYGTATGSAGRQLATVLGTAAVQLPAVWLAAAVALALFGLLPRLAPAAWAVLIGFVALYLLGTLSGLPQWVLDLEPFAHLPLVTSTPGSGVNLIPVAALLAIDAGLVAVGLWAFRRRDLAA
ncbi:ABC transporter permease [Mycolicibacter minnesotensis]